MEDFISKLESQLKIELPGEQAHNLMLPRMSNGSGVRFRNSADPRRGAVLILFYEKDGEPHFPLIERPVYDGVHSGQMAFPGGKYEDGDQTLVNTALRETHEEIGVPSEVVKVVGSLSEFMVHASNHLVLPVIGKMKEVPVFVPDKHEVAQVVEVSVAELISESHLKTTQIEVGGGVVLDSPYFDLGNKIVWGATAMMLSELKEIILRS